MTLKNMVEHVQALFPNISRAQIVQEINSVCRDMTRESRAAFGWYTFDSADLVNGETEVYTVPSGILEIYSLEYPTGETIEWFQKWRAWNGRLQWYDKPEDVTTFDALVIYGSPNMTADGDIPLLPAETHQGIVDKILAPLFQRTGQWQQAAALFKSYQYYLGQAKKYFNNRERVNRGGLETTTLAVKIAYGSQPLLAGENTITFNETFASTVFYPVFESGGDQMYEVDPPVRTTNSMVVYAVADIPNFTYHVIGV